MIGYDHVCSNVLIGSIFITSSNCAVTIDSELPSICYASAMISCSGNVYCSAKGVVQWLYPNSTVITTTDEAANVYGNYNIIVAASMLCISVCIVKQYSHTVFLPYFIYAVVDRSTLRFNNPRISDAGKYTCRLIFLNFIKETYTLTILGKLIILQNTLFKTCFLIYS